MKHHLRFFLLIFVINLANAYIGCDKSDSSKSSGNITFEKVFPSVPFGSAVQQTTDGGYIVASEGRATKLDPYGNISWSKAFASYGNGSIIQTTDGGYIAAGYPPVKLTGSGDSVWSAKFNCSMMRPLSDSGYIGGTNINNTSFLLIKFNSHGDTVWTRPLPQLDVYDCRQVSDSGFILAGTDWANGGRIFIAKTDKNGNLLWNKGNRQICLQLGISVMPTTDGGYIVGGIYDWDCVPHAYLIKTNANGDTTWTYINSLNANGSNVEQTIDGGYISAVNMPYTSFVYLSKTDAVGKTQWMKPFSDTAYYYGIGYPGSVAQQTSDHGFVVVGGRITKGSGSSCLYMIRTDENGNVAN